MSSLSITIINPGLQIVPGSAGTFTVEVRNLGSVVDRYRCEILGLDPTWWSVTPGSLELFPQRDGDERNRADAPPTVGRFTVTIRPPRSSAALAGTWGIGAKVSSEHEPADRQVEETSVSFLPYGELEADLRPSMVAGRFGANSHVRLANRGNRPEAITITGSDRSDRISFAIGQARMVLQPGATALSRLRLTSGAPKLVGGSDTQPFTIDVRADSPDTPPVSIAGTHEKKAVVPSGLPAAVAVVLALGMGGAGLLFVQQAQNKVADVKSLAPPTPSIIIVTPPPTTPPPTTPPPSSAPPSSAPPSLLCEPSIVDAKYESLGKEASFLGAALGPCDTLLGNNGDRGRFRDFAGGAIYATPDNEHAFAIQTGVLQFWRGQGALDSTFGFPVEDTAPDANGDGGFSGHFQNGSRIFWTPAAGAKSCANTQDCMPIIIIPQSLPPFIFIPIFPTATP
jgi:LGFP repeat